MGADHKLELGIDVSKIGEGDAQASAGLKEVTQSAADLAKEMGVVNVSAAEAAEILKKTGEGAAQASAGLKEVTQSAADLAKEMGVVNVSAAEAAEILKKTGEGAAQASAGLKEVTQSAADLAKEMGVVNVSAAEAAEILKKTGEGAGEGGEGVKKFNMHGRETHHLAGMLNSVLPGAGTEIRAIGEIAEGSATSGMLALAGAMEMLIKTVEAISASSKAADEALATMYGEKYNPEALQKVAEAWRHAADAHDEYARSLAERHEDDNDPSKGPMERAERAAKEKQSAQQKIDEAQKKLALAYIEEEEKQGLITHEQALNAKLQLDAAYEQRKLALSRQADADELKLKQTTADIVSKQKNEAATKEGAAEQTSAAADAAVAHVQMEIDKTKTGKEVAAQSKKDSGLTDADAQRIRELYEQLGQDSAGKSLEEQTNYLRNYTTKHVLSGGIGMGLAIKDVGVEGANDLRSMFSPVLGGRNISGAQAAAFEGGEKTEKADDKALVKLNAQLITREHEAAAQKAELERQKKLLDEKSAQLDKLQQAIDELKATQQAREQNDATVAGIDAQTDAVKNGRKPTINPFAAPPTAATTATAPAGPQISAATVASLNNAFHSTNDIGGTIAALAAQIERSQNLNHATSLMIVKLIQQGHVKHETVAQMVAEVAAQMGASQNTHDSG